MSWISFCSQEEGRRLGGFGWARLSADPAPGTLHAMQTSRRIALTMTAFLAVLFPGARASLAQEGARARAARTAAESSAACTRLSGFYWEIGDGSGALASGSRGAAAPQAETLLNLYSASKWLYAAYVVERRGGALNESDLRALRLLDGYTETSGCAGIATVGECAAAMARRDTGAVDRFHYASGHFQKHAAVDMELAKLDREALAAEIRRVLVPDARFAYTRVDLAGGGLGSAADYGAFLRRILRGELALSGAALGSHAVCTYTGEADPATGRVPCASASSSPAREALQYSLGHWIESDPAWLAKGGDPAFSSPGLSGFYPWIDSTRRYYGIVARDERVANSPALSVACGREIRRAWLASTTP
jgi:hypothetical protein